MKVKWDMTIQTNKRLARNRTDIALVQLSSHKWILIDVAVPWDKNILKEKQPKIKRILL